MNILNSATTAVGGGALGAVFGAFGSALNRGIGLFESREKRKDRVLEMDHEKDRWVHDQTAETERAAAQQQVEAAKLIAADAKGSWDGLAASLGAEAAIEASYPWVAAVRALTRPGLTLMLWVLFGLIVLAAICGAFPKETADSIARGAVDTVSFSASTALAWWFGDRAPRSAA